jgi:glycosyltransferase involved in cell wall biosynthesis
MKLLFFGDLAPTGFGSVTTDLGRKMLDLGVDVRFISQNDTGTELPEPFRSRTVDLVSLPYRINELSGEAGTIGAADGIPALMDGSTAALLHNGEPAGGWVPEAAIMLGDYYAARHIVGRFVEAFRGLPTWHYCPVEGVGLPPVWKEMWSVLRPVAMSNFGADQMEAVMGYRPPMIYHGIDTDIFRPVSKQRPMSFRQSLTKGQPVTLLTSKADCKQAWVQHLFTVNAGTLERNADGHLVMPTKWLLRTDRHMPRKRYDAMIRTLGPVLERNPGWGLIIHCGTLDQGGWLYEPISKLSPVAQSRIMFTDNGEPPRALGMPREQLALLYNAADMYVSPSAEGFGLTIAEAIACGVPAVGLDYSAVPEVIGPAGVTVPYTHLLDNEYGHAWAAIDEDQFARAVEHLMTHHGKREDLGRSGPAHVRSSFQWASAARQFVDLIHESLSAGVAA